MPGIGVRKLQFLSLLCFLSVAVGCASHDNSDSSAAPVKHRYSDYYEESDVHPVDVYDPLEGLNRHVYKFNAIFDEYVFLPVIRAYETVTPEFFRTGVSNFFTNVGEIITFANEVLQVKFEAAGMTVFRFVANSTVGLFGVFDVTGHEGIPRTREDFGQTLGYWGAGEGPYLVLPILGPSNLRDTTGLATDNLAFALADPLTLSSMQTEYPGILVLNIINQRYTQPFRYYQTGSPFEYDLIRFLYTEKRQADIDK